MKRAIPIALIFGALSVFSGCASTRLTESSTPATIKGEMKRTSPLNWETTRIFRVGDVQLDLAYAADDELSVDPGATVMRVYYVARRGNLDRLVPQTDAVELRGNLKPNGHYQVQAKVSEKTARFSLVDLSTGTVINTSSETPIFMGVSLDRPMLAPEAAPATR